MHFPPYPFDEWGAHRKNHLREKSKTAELYLIVKYCTRKNFFSRSRQHLSLYTIPGAPAAANQRIPEFLVKNFLTTPLIPMSNQKTIFVILSAAKNLSFKAAEILHSAALRSE